MIVQKDGTISQLLLIIMFFSILNNGVLEFFGVRLYLLIALFMFLVYKPHLQYFNNILTHELIYFIILYFIIIFFIPYYDKFDSQRTIFQKYDGRFLSQFVRFTLEIISSFIFYKFYLKHKDLFLKSLVFATYLTIIIALFDFFILNKLIYLKLVGATHAGHRYTALNIEPRMFGIILTYIYVFLKLHFYPEKKLLPIILSILLTLSVSSILIFILSFIYLNKKNYYIIVSAIIIFLSIVIIIIVPNIDNFSLIIDRLIFLSTIKDSDDYFSILSIMEVFDRTALNALLYNKIYLFTGFGPNTISIPSSNYIPIELDKTYDGIINSVPHSGLVNILSRSGLFFLVYYFISFYNKKNKIFFWIYLLQANFVFYSFYLILYNKKEKSE